MFQKEYSFNEFGFSSQMVRDLVSNNASAEQFIKQFFSLSALTEEAKNKSFSTKERTLLYNQLTAQNAGIELSALSKGNIEALKESNTMTITTGHQLNLLTGPLYSIYKVAQVISLVNEMNNRDDGFNYVPVFWMATEDHDFEEINHLHLFGNKIAWDKVGQDEKIVGAITPNSISEFTNQIIEKFRDEEQVIVKQFAAFYTESNNLADATRKLMNHLFAAYGLVIIDGNDAELKKTFATVAQKEVEEAFTYEAVKESNVSLEKAGYHDQVFVRECNLFKIEADGTRKRIAKEGETFQIGDKTITSAELVADIESNPSGYSPNALLRPVYQEMILPNLAYIGGGGEIAYWLQLKGVFAALNRNMPLLRVRDSLILMRDRELSDLEILELTIPELKKNIHELMKAIALNDVEVEIELKEEVAALNKIEKAIAAKAEAVNKGLVGMVGAEFTKMMKSIERLEDKLVKAEKAKHEKKGKKIEKLQARIFPNGGFQERFENFLPYYLSNPDFISKIVDTLTPTDQPKIKVVTV